MNATTTAHVDYPHTPGTLYDCPPCEARMARSNLRNLIALYSGDGDVWGFALGWFFPIAELMTLADIPVPVEWEFRPAPSLDYATFGEDDAQSAELVDLWEQGEITADALTYWGNVLARYADMLRAAGRDY